jgi:transcription termination factor Rho
MGRELLHDPLTFSRMTALRRIFDSLPDKLQPSEMVIEQMRKTKSNDEFLAKFGKK